jgi:hypothetical protein
MRLNKNTYPAYMQLEGGNYMNVEVDELILQEITENKDFVQTKDALFSFTDAMRSVYEEAGRRYYITEPFMQAITTAYPKIKDGQKHFRDVPNDCGVLFTNNGFTLYLSNPADKKLKLIAYGFTRNALTSFAFLTTDDRYGGVACTLKDGKPFSDDEYLQQFINSILATIYFIHNCETEQKIVKPREKYRANGEKHFNESNNEFVVLDCKWFTELIRDTPFHVRGHLRWQAHGTGKQKRKLIWISDFEKQGYHRKATKQITE